MQYTPPPHVTQQWHLTKPSASGRRGIVVSQSRDAAEAGVAVLEAGGNAVDAAVGDRARAARRSSRGIRGSAASASPWCIARASRVAEVVDFGPVRAARPRPVARSS